MKINKIKLIVALAERDMTETKLGVLAGLSRGTISAIKNGKSCTELSAQKIASALGMKVEDLK